jgi:hypothetical protein
VVFLLFVASRLVDLKFETSNAIPRPEPDSTQYRPVVPPKLPPLVPQPNTRIFTPVSAILAEKSYKYKILREKESNNNITHPPLPLRWVRRRQNRDCTASMEDELHAMVDLIESFVPFAMLRLGDGEYAIATNTTYVSGDDWTFDAAKSPYLHRDLTASLTYNKGDLYYVGVPCTNWGHMIRWYLNNAKPLYSHVTYAIVFINANFRIFTFWFERYVVSGSIPTIVIADDVAYDRADLTWPLEIYAFPHVSVQLYEKYREIWISDLVALAKRHENVLFAVMLGPVAKIFVHQMWMANPKNIYVDFGSALQKYVYGQNSRPYADRNSFYSTHMCTPFKPCDASNATFCDC